MSVTRAFFYAGRRAARRNGGSAGGLVVTLVVIAVVLQFIWWIVGVVLVAGAAWLGYLAVRRRQTAVAATRRGLADLAARADRQHEWLMVDDDRGLYGDYPSAALG